MKKLFAAVFAFLLGASSLFAGDVEDVKAVVLKDWQLASQGKFADLLTQRTADYVEVNGERIFPYEHIRWTVLALDGKHPEEFILMMLVAQSRGNLKLTPDMRAKISEAARSPEFIESYKNGIGKMAAMLQTDAAFQLETLKLIDIKVDGDAATVVCEFDSKASGSVVHKIETVSLRKVDGAWKICKAVIENKK